MATTDDSMDDDVFEAVENSDNLLKTLPKVNHPSPTGYRNYQPPAEILKLCQEDIIEEIEPIIHKVIIIISFIKNKMLLFRSNH